MYGTVPTVWIPNTYCVHQKMEKNEKVKFKIRLKMSNIILCGAV